MGELASKIRAKYPGAYDSLSDSDLESKVTAKYPGVYDHLAGPKTKTAPSYTPEQSEQMRQQFIDNTAAPMTKLKENTLSAVRSTVKTARPTVEMLGSAVGAALGGGGALVAGQAGPQILVPEEIATVPAAATAGGALGYAITKRGLDRAEQALGMQPTQGFKEAAISDLKAVGEGAAGEALGLGLGKILSATAPVAAKVGAKAVAKAGDMAAGVLGTTTGTGKEYVKQAIKGGTAFKEAMREPDGAKVVDTAKGALQKLREFRGDEYRQAFDEIAKDKQQLDISPVVSKWGSISRKYGIRLAEDGSIDLSRSTIPNKERGDLEEIVKTLGGWGREAEDLTPKGLDLLKRKLDNLYTESRDSKAIVSELRKVVKDTLASNVEGYAKMTKGYEEATKLINEMDRTLSLGKKPMLDTTMRKLQQSMRDNFQFRKELLDTLEMKSGEDLADMIAGYSMSSWTPQGGFGKLTSLGSAGMMAFGHVLTPAYLTTMALSSPRVVGETLHAMGATAKTIARVTKMLPELKTAALRASENSAITGRLQEQTGAMKASGDNLPASIVDTPNVEVIPPSASRTEFRPQGRTVTVDANRPVSGLLPNNQKMLPPSSTMIAGEGGGVYNPSAPKQGGLTAREIRNARARLARRDK